MGNLDTCLGVIFVFSNGRGGNLLGKMTIIGGYFRVLSHFGISGQ